MRPYACSRRAELSRQERTDGGHLRTAANYRSVAISRAPLISRSARTGSATPPATRRIRSTPNSLLIGVPLERAPEAASGDNSLWM